MLELALFLSLDSDNFLIRERATIAIQHNLRAMPLVAGLAESTLSPEVEARCKRILNYWRERWLPERLPAPRVDADGE